MVTGYWGRTQIVCTNSPPPRVDAVEGRGLNARAQKIGRFYAEHRQGLYSYALSLTGDRARAEDAVHAAIEKLLSRPLLPFRLKLYAFRCVRNAAISAWRRDEARREPLFDFSTLPAAPAADRHRAEELAAALGRLGEDERETIVLKIFEDLTFREIAAVRGIPANTAASHYRRGIEKLRALCAEDKP